MSVEKYIVADYVDDFHCKCGECRSCCCVGWPVTISYNEYNKLLGLQCSHSLKRRLDCAFYVLKDCTSDRYAEINRDRNGECHLRDADGKCALQKDLGEKALPEICKMYPRNFVSSGIKEGACALSCEGVLEELFSSTAKLSFRYEEISLSENIPKSRLPDSFFDIQKKAIDILESREIPVSERLICLGRYLFGLCKKVCDGGNFGASVFGSLMRLMNYLNNYSGSFSKPGSEAYAALSDRGDASMKKYSEALNHLYAVIPQFDIFIEKIMVNHLFFSRFPNPAYGGENILDEYTAFIGVYALTKLTAAGYMVGKDSIGDLVDCTAAIFRYLEHGDADIVIKRAFSSCNLLSFAALSAVAAV